MYHQPECGIQIDLFRIFLSASSSTGPTDAVQGEETTVIFYFTLWKASNKKRKVSNADEEGRVWSIRTTERERERLLRNVIYIPDSLGIGVVIPLDGNAEGRYSASDKWGH